MKKTKELAKDSIFCAVVSTLIILFNFISMFDYMYISIIITIFVSCYFQNKTLTRMLMSSAVVFAVCMLLINPTFVLAIILPSIILGVICSLFFKKNVKFLFFFLILSAVCFLLNVTMELLFVKVIMGMDLTQYILADDIFNLNAYLSQFGSLLITVYMIVILVISVLEILILFNVNRIYKSKIAPMIGERF